MTKWQEKRFSGEELDLAGGRIRLGYGWNSSRSKGDVTTKDENYVGCISMQINMKPTKTAEDMKAAMLRTLRKYLTQAIAELDVIETETPEAEP